MRLNFVVCAAIVCLCAFSLSGCSRKERPLVHDPAVVQQLEGSWELALSLETQISSDEADPQLVTGTVASRTTTVLSLKGDQTFSLESRQEFLSYTPVEGVEPLPEEVVRGHFSQSVKVMGTYAATAQVIEYDQAEVSVNDGAPVPFEEFVAMTGQTEERVQRALWSLHGDRLTFALVQGEGTEEVVYTRVK